MKTIALGVLGGIVGFLLLVELLLRALPVSGASKAAYTIDPHILTYAPRRSFGYATGWDLRNPQRLVTNGHGFVADRDFTRNPNAVALVGDSFVESASLDAADRPAAQLERALRGRPVYAMGSAGTALLDYAERIRFAHQQFGIRDFVVLMERGDVMQSLCGSGNVASQCLDPRTLAPRTEQVPPPSLLKRMLRESALAQYAVSQLKISPAGFARQLFTRTPGGAPASPATVVAGSGQASLAAPEVDVIANSFFSRVMPHVEGRLVIAIDADRQALMHHRRASDPNRARFVELARAAGAVVIDMEPLFRQHFESSGLSLDVGPYDGHLNVLGVRLLAGAMGRALSE